jgi:hypothetical protein
MKPRNAQEVYRLEKMRRGLPVQEYKIDGKRSKVHDAKPTSLVCPRCKSDLFCLGRIRGKKRQVRCMECLYFWWTSSKEAFGGFRYVEVRG